MTAGLLAVAVAFAGSEPVAQPEDADWAWLDHSRQAAFESLMPVAASPDLVLTYFSYRDLHYDELEAYFSISLAKGDSSPSAYVVKPIGASVQKQLLDMHIADRRAPLSDLLSRVRVSRCGFRKF